MPDGIQFNNIHHESMLLDLFADEVGQDNNDSCVSDDDCKDRKNHEIGLKNLVANVGINDDEVGDLDNEDAIHLNNGFSDIEDIVNDGFQHEG